MSDDTLKRPGKKYEPARAEPRLCEKCGKPFAPRLKDLQRGYGKRCSRSCATRISRASSARFWDKVDKNGPIPLHRPELGACWLWTAHIATSGYGRLGGGGRAGG